MTCGERRDLLLLAVAGALDSAENRELQEHLDGGCPSCAGALAEAEAVLAPLPLTLAPVPLPAGLRDRLMERVASRRDAPPRRAARTWLAWAAAAAVVLAAGVSTYFSMRQSGLEGRLDAQASRIAELEATVERAAGLEETVACQATELEQLRDAMGGSSELQATLELQQGEIGRLGLRMEGLREDLEGRDAEIRRLQAALGDRELRLASYRSPDVRVFSLRGTEGARLASARIFWHPREARWDIFAAGLEDPGIAKTYQLWFITADDRKIPAATFDVVDGQAALLNVRIPRDAGPVVAAAVTDEPLGGSLRPTGKIRLVGELPRS